MSFNNAADNLVYLTSTSSSTFNVTGSVFSYPGVISGTANSAILLEPSGAANLTASITGSTFTDIVSASTQIGANTVERQRDVVADVLEQHDQLGDWPSGGVVVSGQELTTTSLTITSNTFTGAGGNGVISIDTNDTSTVTGTISNNTITNPPGIGIFSAVDEAATSTLTFNGNTITNSGGDGIQLVNFGGVGVLDDERDGDEQHGERTQPQHRRELRGRYQRHRIRGGHGPPAHRQLRHRNPGQPRRSAVARRASTTTSRRWVEPSGSRRSRTRRRRPPTPPTSTATNDAGPVTIFGVIDLSNGVEISSS